MNYRLFILKSKQIKLWHSKHICICSKYMTYSICENTLKMKVIYLLILPFPLLNCLFSNTSTCQCTCHIPSLGETGDNHTYSPNSVLMDPLWICRYLRMKKATFRGLPWRTSILPYLLKGLWYSTTPQSYIKSKLITLLLLWFLRDEPFCSILSLIQYTDSWISC